MFTLQSLMLIVLGFLIASFFVILVAPAYRRRVTRLTTDAIRQSVPITEAEIRADKDRMRAQYAIRVHKLEAQGEQQRLAAARQLIEMNRRDARVTDLETEAERLRASLEENVNARRVLEHTVTDRLPRLEQQLDSARTLISARDQEMAALKVETTRSVKALDEALQINLQQRGEIERMSASLMARAPAGIEPQGIAQFDGEIALRSEIEALRSKTREQAELISRLQSAAGAADSARVLRDLEETDASLKAIKSEAQLVGSAAAAAEARAASLKSQLGDQAAEVARLKAALAAYETDDAGGAQRGGIVRDRLGSKAKITSLQAQVATQTETIQSLRGELAANNERLARQRAQFAEEMRRLGVNNISLVTDAQQTREPAPRRSLSDRISQNPGAAAPAVAPANGHAAEAVPADAGHANGSAALAAAAPAVASFASVVADMARGAAPEAVMDADGTRTVTEPSNRVRLLDRIAGINKT